MEAFLAATDVIDWRHRDVLAHAKGLANGCVDSIDVAKRCFEWVRDSVKHSCDFDLPTVTCSASQVLSAGTGICYAKSHLLAALLRANSIPAGFCYQRLSLDGAGPPFCLHGLNAVNLPNIGWYRVDARGNKAGVNAQFTPPVESLAFATQLPGEADLRDVFAEPLPIVVDALRRHRVVADLANDLPDVVVRNEGVAVVPQGGR